MTLTSLSLVPLIFLFLSFGHLPLFLCLTVCLVFSLSDIFYLSVTQCQMSQCVISLSFYLQQKVWEPLT